MSVTLAANVQNLTGTGTANISLTGNTFSINNAADVITKSVNAGNNLEQGRRHNWSPLESTKPGDAHTQTAKKEE